MAATLNSSLRALFGVWAGDRPAPLPPILPDLPDMVASVVRKALPMLAHYQGIAYARLYLHRLRRFIGRPDVDDAMFARIAELMAERMTYQDPIRVAQQVLEGASTGPDECRFTYRFGYLVEALPEAVADPLLAILQPGWTDRRVTLRYLPHSIGGRARLRFEASLRYWRALGRNAKRERVWVERWLHMVDRALTLQPAAASAVVETATMVTGYGDTYAQGLAEWHRLIDGLVKPTFDGKLNQPDLAAAIAQARGSAACNSSRPVP